MATLSSWLLGPNDYRTAGFPYSRAEPPVPTFQGRGEYIAEHLTREVPGLPMKTYRMLALTTLRTSLLVAFAALLILVFLPLAVAAQAAAR
jgi:hypothetical protein